MRFYYINSLGDSGHFTLKKAEIPKAIMSAWNIEAELSVVIEKIDKYHEKCQLIFSPADENDFNNELLNSFGLYIKDGESFKELHYLKDGSLAWEPDNWDGILQLT
ncbi:hypothetical protein [uncultured Robinsoniella sp.]|uniref:hypothetical protein n=1 Tax=Robinsoniella sp. TaxID=2496533 RepID=UPI00374E838B